MSIPVTRQTLWEADDGLWMLSLYGGRGHYTIDIVRNEADNEALVTVACSAWKWKALWEFNRIRHQPLTVAGT